MEYLQSGLPPRPASRCSNARLLSSRPLSEREAPDVRNMSPGIQELKSKDVPHTQHLPLALPCLDVCRRWVFFETPPKLGFKGKLCVKIVRNRVLSPQLSVKSAA